MWNITSPIRFIINPIAENNTHTAIEDSLRGIPNKGGGKFGLMTPFYVNFRTNVYYTESLVCNEWCKNSFKYIK